MICKILTECFYVKVCIISPDGPECATIGVNIKVKQSATQGRWKFQNELQAFTGHKITGDPVQQANGRNSFAAEGTVIPWNMGIQASEGRASLIIKNSDHTGIMYHRTEHERFAGDNGGIIDQIMGRKIIRGIQNDIIRGNNIQYVGLGKTYVMQLKCCHPSGIRKPLF